LKQIVDFHIHSPFSRGVSKNMQIAILAAEARKKGLDIIGTGDIFHKQWNKYLQENLPCEVDGLYSPSKKEYNTLFIATGEVEDNEHIHHLVIVPSLKTGIEIAIEFEKKNKIKLSRYGGRPRVDMDASQLVDLVKEYNCLIGPAHIFTPFTSIFRENKYSSLKNCFKESTVKVDFVELGLSANSAMADKIKELWGYTFLSNSDSHSPKSSKIGREANVIEVNDVSFSSIQKSLEKGKEPKIVLNIGLDPRLGKYHLSFCYKCRRRVIYIHNPSKIYDEKFIYFEKENEKQFMISISTRKLRCPACNGLLKLGVNDRVKLLATTNKKNTKRPPYFDSVPLVSLISKGLKIKNPDSKTVIKEYHRLIATFENEYNILLNASIEEIRKENDYVGKKIELMRENKLEIIPGGGGNYGELV